MSYFVAEHKSQQGLCCTALLLNHLITLEQEVFQFVNFWNISICGLGNLKWLDAISCTRTKTRVTHSLTLLHTVWIKTFSCSMLCFSLTYKRKPHQPTNNFNGKAPFSKQFWILSHECISNNLQLHTYESSHNSTELQLVT